nr:hypothetical protein Itr_chr02CG19140 [Ipomoea trifida]
MRDPSKMIKGIGNNDYTFSPVQVPNLTAMQEGIMLMETHNFWMILTSISNCSRSFLRQLIQCHLVRLILLFFSIFLLEPCCLIYYADFPTFRFFRCEFNWVFGSLCNCQCFPIGYSLWLYRAANT